MLKKIIFEELQQANVTHWVEWPDYGSLHRWSDVNIKIKVFIRSHTHTHWVH